MTKTTGPEIEEMADALLRAMLQRGDKAIDKAMQEWLLANLLPHWEEFPLLHLSVQSAALSIAIEMYEVASKAGLIVAASLVEKSGMTKDQAIKEAKDLISQAGGFIIENHTAQAATQH